MISACWWRLLCLVTEPWSSSLSALLNGQVVFLSALHVDCDSYVCLGQQQLCLARLILISVYCIIALMFLSIICFALFLCNNCDDGILFKSSFPLSSPFPAVSPHLPSSLHFPLRALEVGLLKSSYEVWGCYHHHHHHHHRLLRKKQHRIHEHKNADI